MDDLDRRVTRWLEEEARGEPPPGIADAVAARIRAPLDRPHPTRAATSWTSTSFLVAAAAAVVILAVLASVLPTNVPGQTLGLGVGAASPSASVGLDTTPTPGTSQPATTRGPNAPTRTLPPDPGLEDPTPAPRPPRTPPPPFTPSGPPVARVLDRSVRLEMWLSASEVSHGEILWGLIRIANEGQRTVYYQGGGCIEPADVTADYSGLYPRGDDWTGLEAEAKSFLLGSVDPRLDPLLELFQRGDVFERDFDCNTDLRTERLEPRQVIDHWVGWRASFEGVLPLPSGSVGVTASFPHLGFARPRGQSEPVVVETQVTVSGAARDYLAPGELVDVLLRDGRFREWLGREGSSDWITPTWLLKRGTAKLGMSRRGPGSDHAHLTIDIRTGAILEWDITD